MVYDSPGVWRPESVARQQDLDDLRDEFDGHHHDERYATRGPRGKAYLSTGNHTSVGNWQKVPLSPLVYEFGQGPASWWDAANSRMVCARAGVFNITGHVGFSGSTAFTGLGGIAIRVNGGGALTDHFTPPGYFYRGIAGTDFYLNVGDYVELWVYQAAFASVGYAAGVECCLAWSQPRD